MKKTHLKGYNLHCAFDLELEQPKSNPNTRDSYLNEEKIIQLGYVIYKLEPEFEVVCQRSIFINIGVPLSGYIKKLTGISDEDIASGGTIKEAYQQLITDLEKYDFNRVLKQWGSNDDVTLKEELHGVAWKFGRSACNIKHLSQIYLEANGMNTSGGLAKTMKKVGIKFDGRAHDAAVDALNTALMYSFLYDKFKNS